MPRYGNYDFLVLTGILLIVTHRGRSESRLSTHNLDSWDGESVKIPLATSIYY